MQTRNQNSATDWFDKEQEQSVRSWRPMLSHPLFLIGFATVGILVSGWVASQITPKYLAMTRIQCTVESPEQATHFPSEEQLASFVLDDRNLQQAVLSTIRVPEDHDWSSMIPNLRPLYSVECQELNPTLREIRVAFEYRHAELARRLANQTAINFIDMMQQTGTIAHQKQHIEHLSQEVAQAEQNWEQAWKATKELLNSPERGELQQIERQIEEIEIELASLQSDWNDSVASARESDGLPIAPALTRSDDYSQGTLVERTLQLYLKQRAEIVSQYTEQHPAIAGLDRKIQNLAQQAGIPSLASVDGIRQASFEAVQPAVQSTQDQATLAAKAKQLRQRYQALVQEAKRRQEIEVTINQRRAEVEQLFAQKSAIQQQLQQASQQLESMQHSQPVTYSMPPVSDAEVAFVGPDRRHCFIGGIFLTGLATLGCFWTGRAANAGSESRFSV